MKTYQYNLNTIAWLAIIAIIIALSLSSCKKDKQLEPEPLPITQSTIHYKRIATFMFQYDEAADLYVYGNTMSGPCSSSALGGDTVNYPHFYYTPKLTPLVINGNCTISSNNDTLYLTYSNHNPIVNTTNWVIKAKYLRQ